MTKRESLFYFSRKPTFFIYIRTFYHIYLTVIVALTVKPQNK